MRAAIAAPPPLGGAWIYTIKGGNLVKIAEHDSDRFTPGASGLPLFDTQAHYTDQR